MTTEQQSGDSHRGTRSYVRRQGRLTTAQRRALEQQQRLILPVDRDLNWRDTFGRQAPVWLEIGFGNGATLAHLAATRPERDFVGIDVHRPGVGHLLMETARLELQNVRVVADDAVAFIERVPAASLERVLILFPDPWPKARHRKRRLVQTEFAGILAEKLFGGGVLHLATDWQDYAEQMLSALEPLSVFRNMAGAGSYSTPPDYRIPTRFEERGKRHGNVIRDLLYQRL